MEDNQTVTKTVDDLSPPAAGDDRTIAIVAPQWLQDGLAVVIKSIPHLQLIACTGSVQILLLLDLKHAPDLVVLTLDKPDIKASDQIKQVKFIYPYARCLVLIQEPAHSTSVHAAGADETLLQGASAEQFCMAVRRLIQRHPLGGSGKLQDA
jgi:DNA-binding NarL/FixJ family response regulator